MLIRRSSAIPPPEPVLYLFAEMAIGDSLWVGGNAGRAMFSAARRFAARHPPWRCTGQKQARGWRVWRIK